MSYKSILIGLKSNKGIIKGWVQDLLDEIPKEVLKEYVLDVIRDYNATQEYGITGDIKKSTFERIFNDKLFLYTDEGICPLWRIDKRDVDFKTFDGKVKKITVPINRPPDPDGFHGEKLSRYLSYEYRCLKIFSIENSNIPKEPIVFVLSNGEHIIEQNIDDWLSYIGYFIENEEKNKYSYTIENMENISSLEIFKDTNGKKYYERREARKIKEIYLNPEKYYIFQRFFYNMVHYHKYINHNHDGTLTLNYLYPINIKINEKYHLTD